MLKMRSYTHRFPPQYVITTNISIQTYICIVFDILKIFIFVDFFIIGKFRGKQFTA